MATSPERLKLQRTLDILKCYFDEQVSVGEIAKRFNMSRSMVFQEINTSQQSLRLQLQAQIAGVIKDSVLSLSAMTETMRLRIEGLGANAKVEELSATAHTIQMYSMLFDRVMPIIKEYTARNGLAGDVRYNQLRIGVSNEDLGGISERASMVEQNDVVKRYRQYAGGEERNGTGADSGDQDPQIP